MRTRLVERATDWSWSSARAHVLGEDSAGLLDRELWREVAPLDDWADVLATTPADAYGWDRRFRAATYAGKPLGSREFVAALEKQAGISLELRRPGRPRKKADANAAAG